MTSKAFFVLFLLCFVLACFSQTALASAGNEDHRYRSCLARCINAQLPGRGRRRLRLCRQERGDVGAASVRLELRRRLPLPLCDRKPRAAHQERRAIRAIPRQVGIHRVLGIQELFSSLFSVLNAVPHVLHLHTLNEYRKTTEFGGHWLSFAAVGINTWFWSALFHARDTPFTEKMDYFSALLLIVWGLWVAVVRTLYLHRRKSLQALILAGILLFYLGHISYLTFVRFDYGYNILVNTVTAFLGSFFWLVWLWKHRSRKYVNLLFWAIVGVYPMALLELLDFPPFFNLIDAHALWHFSTIPFSFMMYAGVTADLQYSSNTVKTTTPNQLENERSNSEKKHDEEEQLNSAQLKNE